MGDPLAKHERGVHIAGAGEAHQALAFAPASVANLGVGFDVLGAAFEPLGDQVEARRVERAGVRIISIDGDGGKLPWGAEENVAAVAAGELLRRLELPWGVELSLTKGLGIGTGLGSSAASAVAAALAVNGLLAAPLPLRELLEPCLVAEERVSGRHGDNIAASLLGGWVLVRSLDPFDLIALPVPDGLTLTVVSPELRLDTRAARAALPEQLPRATTSAQLADLGAFIAALYRADSALLKRSGRERIAEAARLPLIPGASAALAAARASGALLASISGAGPSLFGLFEERAGAERGGEAMVDAFAAAGVSAVSRCAPAQGRGARLLSVE